MVTISELNTSFKKVMEEIQTKYENMMEDEHTQLFMVEATHNELWNRYQTILNEHDLNPIYKENPYHECSSCRNFFNSHANIIYLHYNRDDSSTPSFESIFNITSNTFYDDILQELSNYIIQKPIQKPYIPSQKVVGNPLSYEMLENGEVIEHHHYYLKTKSKDTIQERYVGAMTGDINTNKELLEKLFNTENIKEALNDVNELIDNDNLYRGNNWRNIIKSLITNINSYNSFNNNEKQLFLWYLASTKGQTYCHITNTVMGELLQNIAEGMNIEEAVRIYENMTAPTNYQRPKPIVTEAMINKAKDTINELGYLESLGRKHASLDDIPVTEVLWSNKEKPSNDIFEELKKDAIHKETDYSKRQIKELSFKDFIEMTKTVESIEIYIDNSLTKNFMTLITATDPQSKPLFKWNNHLSWSYIGNLADSDIKSNVRKAGGTVDGVLRFSIQWNDTDYHSTTDLDAHCIEPNGNEISFDNKKSYTTLGFLDIDIINPQPNVPAVENITYPKIDTMVGGDYKFFVHNYLNNRGNIGFKAEIEYDNDIRKYEYNHPLKQNERVTVATVTLNDNKFSIEENLPSTKDNKKIWNIPINSFQPVTVITTSPNAWNNSNSFKHIFFILRECKCDEDVNGYYNEYLNSDLREHKKVMELLSSKTKVIPEDEEVSGVGFTRNCKVLVRINNKELYYINI